MSYTEEQLWTLLDQAYHMPYGPGQTALVEQVIAHADAQHLTPLAFAARMQATKSYVYGGERARSFATFAWCLAEFDRNPAAYQSYYRLLLWHFKYMVSALTKFPEVPLERTYGVLDDMERRYRETGHSLHAVYAYRHDVAAHIGDFEAAEAYYTQWCAAPRDDLSDCLGCDPTSKAWWLAQRGRYEEAVAVGDPVLSGQLTCAEQPQSMLTTLMIPYLRTGRLEQARDAHRRAYRLQRSQLADLAEIGEHIEFCARTGNEARALEIVERHLGWLDRAPSPWAAMMFAASASLALRRAQDRRPDEELTVHRPAHGDRPALRVGVRDLAAELAAQATDLAERFDRRNGTDRVGTVVREILNAEPLIEFLPLSPTASPPRRPATATATNLSTVEDVFAKSTPPVADAPAGPAPVVVPETSGPDELLELIDEYYETHRDALAEAALDAFDARYGDRELTTRQRARLTEARATRLSDHGDYAGAADLWREASQVFAAAGDHEGEHRARARAAAVVCWLGDRDDELPALVEATEWLLTHGSPKARVGAATRLAIVHFNGRRVDQALATLDRAGDGVDAAPLATRAQHAAVRLMTLGQLHRVDEVLQAGPATVELTEAAGLTEELARVHSTLAAALQYTGALSQAADHLAAAIAVLSNEEDRAGLRRARAELLAQTERAGEVIDELVEQVADSTARGELAAAANWRRSLAIAYANVDRLLDAAEVAEEELAYRLRHRDEADESGGVPAVRDLLATIYQRLGQPTEAVGQLDAIIDELTGPDHRAAVGQLTQRAGEILADADRDEEAAARFLKAADICAELDLPLPELYNRRRHAIALHWASRTDQAVSALAAADALAARVPIDDEAIRWEQARLDFDAARILWGAERLAEAAQRAGRAAEASLHLGSAGSAAQCRLMQAQILLNDGQPGAAEAAARHGLELLPDGANREPFLGVLEAARSAGGHSDWAKETS